MRAVLRRSGQHEAAAGRCGQKVWGGSVGKRGRAACVDVMHPYLLALHCTALYCCSGQSFHCNACQQNVKVREGGVGVS